MTDSDRNANVNWALLFAAWAVKPVFCDTCGGREFWQLPGGRWMCSKCRPQPAETTPKPYPKAATFYPLMAIQAARRAAMIGGGYRAWVMGKALDVKGWGMVKRADLAAFAQELGVNLRTWQRWLNEARANDFLIDVQKGDDWYFILPSSGRVAMAMGLENIGNRKAIIELSLLVGKGWKARVYSTWEDGKQITREQIQRL